MLIHKINTLLLNWSDLVTELKSANIKLSTVVTPNLLIKFKQNYV